jgi:uncharacterized protein
LELNASGHRIQIIQIMINLIPLTDNYTIYQLKDSQEIPPQILKSEFYSITRTEEEISIIANCEKSFNTLNSNKGWKGFKVDGVLDFSSIGIINCITKPLKENAISVFVISTFNTDYIFVKEESFQKACEVLKNTDSIGIKFV